MLLYCDLSLPSMVEDLSLPAFTSIGWPLAEQILFTAAFFLSIRLVMLLVLPWAEMFQSHYPYTNMSANHIHTVKLRERLSTEKI